MWVWVGSARALTPQEALILAEGETADRIAVMGRLAASGDPQAEALIRAMAREAVMVRGEQVLIVEGETAIDAVTGAPASAEGATSAMVNNRLRGALERALAALDLLGGDARRQREAALRLRDSLIAQPDASVMPWIENALASQNVSRLDGRARRAVEEARAALWLESADAAQRMTAVQTLAHVGQDSVRARLAQRQEQESDPAVKAALAQALAQVDRALIRAQVVGQLFTGVSLGSILLLAALGLAITYGLMGVINMAHGELIMIGAYATYVVQGLFRQYLPGAFEWYLLAALPVAFLAAALVGAVMERGVIRWLYGRPLETLLATWGLSLILMQGVRSVFGAQNVAVESPGWMSGGVVVMGDLTLPWNRIVIIGFALTVLVAVALLIGRTRLGLFVRGVTQNRPIAACMGVNTARVDTYAFALGSGIAGLAGVALSQVGNVGPDLGQSYIIDSFMVVVLGGVGQLAGAVYAALGLGLLNKFIEGWAGAVLAKIAVLVFIIVFIQKRPQGIFALKGRQA
ncbi:MAG: urea ABC transporter permease subunit UrtB [Tepidimonas fonticaldi]|nr:urea ABC transporter permease subunit UrtB [Tepidimonas fonticaldi]